jgi:hypothetical protein
MGSSADAAFPQQVTTPSGCVDLMAVANRSPPTVSTAPAQRGLSRGRSVFSKKAFRSITSFTPRGSRKSFRVLFSRYCGHRVSQLGQNGRRHAAHASGGPRHHDRAMVGFNRGSQFQKTQPCRKPRSSKYHAFPKTQSGLAAEPPNRPARGYTDQIHPAYSFPDHSW